MSPIYPIVIPAAQVANSSWATAEEFASIVLHIKNLCSNFPSILMAYSADFEAKVNASLLAEEIVNGNIKNGDKVIVTTLNKKIHIEKG